MSIAMRTPHEHMGEVENNGGEHEHGHEHGGSSHTHASSAAHGHDVTPFLAQAAENVSRAFPLVMHPERWTETAHAFDELMIDWGNLPTGARASLFLPALARDGSRRRGDRLQLQAQSPIGA